MDIILQDRPGQLLYMMLNAAIWGKQPWGYHLTSNLLHAANVALLYIVLRRFVWLDLGEVARRDGLKVQIAMVLAALIFALHPIAVEPVSGVSFCGDLLVTFFTLLALLAAFAFRADNLRTALWMGGAGSLCALVAVTCKESGLSIPAILIVYWFLFRRHEAKGPWLLFLGVASILPVIFMLARFHSARVSQEYLGGSFAQVFVEQPRLVGFHDGPVALADAPLS